MEESLKHGKDAVIAHLDAAEVLQPGVGALDFPALAVSAQLAFVLEAAVADVVSVGNNQLRTLPFQSRPQRIGVIAPIGNDAPEMRARASPPGPRHPHLADRALREPALGNLRGRKLRSDRYAPAVDHHHALRTFPATRFADCRAPFFAVIKVASRKASSQSSNRRSSSRESSFRHAACQTSCSSHLRRSANGTHRQAIEHGWSRNVLVHQIESRLFNRQGKAITNFRRTLPADQSELAQEIVKDPHYFDFLSVGPDMLEHDLERGLLEHLRSLILELGKGFAFVGSQYHLEIGGQDYYLDLLFYHLRLRCFVVIDLKIEEFKPEFAGKMNFYLSAIDDQLRRASDGPSIGIILCNGRNQVVVEYALRDSAKPMGVAEYVVSGSLPAQLRNELPTAEEFAREFPYMSVVKLRIEIERAIRPLLASRGIDLERPTGIARSLRELECPR